MLQGYTAVHEVGHWLSLLHPFEGGCTESNDGCTDTAETAQPIMTCPTAAVSTCPHKPKNQPASDPIHNFMVRRLTAFPLKLPKRRAVHTSVCCSCTGTKTLPCWVQSYTPDACMSHFTSQQMLRVGSSWTAYRASYQLKPLQLPGGPVLRLAPSPPPPPAKKKPVAPVAKPKPATIPAKPVAAAARMAPAKVTKPPVKRAAG